MTVEDVDIIVQKASELKNLANSKVEFYLLYPSAQVLYIECYNIVSQLTDIDEIQKQFLSTIYLYESLDCEYSFKLKKKEFSECVTISKKQQQLISDIFSAFPNEKLINEDYRPWYEYLQDHKLSAELKEYFPIGKIFFDEKQFREALHYFRRSEELLEKRDYSKLSDTYRKNYELNHVILNFNISQCQVGILKSSKENKEFLERQIIKGLLQSLDFNRKIILKSADTFYESANVQIVNLIKQILKGSINSWQTIYEYSISEELFSIMTEIDTSMADKIFKSISLTDKKVDYMLFSTHGFNTRGEWKNDLTEVFTNMQRLSKVNFVIIPWDYGTFILQFFIQGSRKRAIRNFQKKYQEVLDLYGHYERKCIIAHSFGTYIIGTAIQENQKFVCDKIVFAGNILDRDYNWQKLKDRNQIKSVLIEKSTDDFAVLAAFFLRKFCFQKWIGYAGRFGFKNNYPFIRVIETKSGHSRMLNKKNMIDNWFFFLTE